MAGRKHRRSVFFIHCACDIFVACFGRVVQFRASKRHCHERIPLYRGLTQSQVRPTSVRGGQTVDRLQTWDTCASAIIYGGDAEQAQKRFEAWCRLIPDGENPSRWISKDRRRAVCG